MMIELPSRHPTHEIDRFATGEASTEERLQVVRHLLEGCPECAGRCWGHLFPEVDLGSLGETVDRVVEQASAAAHRIEAEQGEAHRWLEEVEHQTVERQRELLAELPSERSWALCELVIEQARESRHQDAARTLRLAELAVRVGEALKGEIGAADLRARAWAELGNARRIAGDLAGASSALTEAHRLAATGSGDPLLRAELLLLGSSLVENQRRFEEAIQLLERAQRLYQRYGDRLGTARVLLKLGTLHEHRGNPELGLPHATRALELLQPTDEIELKLAAVQNLAYLMAETGSPQEAMRLVSEATPLLERSGAHLDKLRFEWLTARLENDLGRTEDAAERLEALRHSYLEERLPHEVALVSLELAGIYARLGRRGRVKELASETVGIFQSLGIARESIAALALLAQAEEAEAADLIARLTTVVESAQGRRPDGFRR